ncbi:GNAT family N-acetyltransferase [Streptomyces hawaiiensis]|uniref:GNAT family N-acetyltransferase n=1 Tax=Streptomyces hawaiiensis TaxID=67305 RepID=UPI003661ECDD
MSSSLQEAGEGYIERVAVRRDHRNRGIAGLVLRQCLPDRCQEDTDGQAGYVSPHAAVHRRASAPPTGGLARQVTTGVRHVRCFPRIESTSVSRGSGIHAEGRKRPGMPDSAFS